MTTHHRISDPLRWRAVGRNEAGQSQAEVAKWLSVLRKVVSELWRQFTETGTITRKRGQGRPKVTTTREDRYVVITARRHREMTARQLTVNRALCLHRNNNIETNCVSKASQG